MPKFITHPLPLFFLKQQLNKINTSSQEQDAPHLPEWTASLACSFSWLPEEQKHLNSLHLLTKGHGRL
jgi:hypothetical protein